MKSEEYFLKTYNAFLKLFPADTTSSADIPALYKTSAPFEE
jgi:hypothetical protein